MPIEIPITKVITETIVLSDDIKEYDFYGRADTGNAFGGSRNFPDYFPDYYVARHLKTGYWRFFSTKGEFNTNYRSPNYFDLGVLTRWRQVKVIPPQKDWKFEVVNEGPNN